MQDTGLQKHYQATNAVRLPSPAKYTFDSRENNILSRPRIYEHLGRNPVIIYWQIRQPVTINMCTSYWIVSLVGYLEVWGSNIYSRYSSCFYLPSQYTVYKISCSRKTLLDQKNGKMLTFPKMMQKRNIVTGSLLQPWVVEVRSTLALPKALQINGSIHQRKQTWRFVFTLSSIILY